jgi:peptidyl-dipeptidase A
MTNLSSQLETIYGTAKVCMPNDSSKCVPLDPDLTNTLTNSRDYDELLWAWKGWHDATGPKMRSLYTETVTLQNKGARDSNYKDLSERWIEDFEVKNFEEIVDNLYVQIKPLYEQLHAYARRKIDSFYGAHYKSSHNPKLIQAHLLGLIL